MPHPVIGAMRIVDSLTPWCGDGCGCAAAEVISDILRRELGRPWQEVFAFVDPKPLASASIAQVITWPMAMASG
jgi:hypothetical protein